MGGAKECTQIDENGLSELFWGICVHCCGVEDRCGDAGVYTDRRKWSLGAVLGHLCTLLRRELRRVARAPQLPWCAGSAPSVPCLSPSRENRLCASGAAARLAFSPGRQPTQTPEEPVLLTDFALFCWLTRLCFAGSIILGRHICSETTSYIKWEVGLWTREVSSRMDICQGLPT